MINGKTELGRITWFSSNRISHYYFIHRPDGALDMVDTSAPVERLKIDLYLKRNSKKLKRLLLTHGHADHAGNAQYLQKKYHCEVQAHPHELPFLHGKAELDNRDYTGINPFGRLIQFGDWLFGQPRCHEATTLKECEHYSIIPLHGHTPGSVGILHKETKSLFLGDALLNCTAIFMRPKPGLTIPYHYFSEDQEMALMSLRNLEQVDFENAFFGHGDPLIGNAKEQILSFLKAQQII